MNSHSWLVWAGAALAGLGVALAVWGFIGVGAGGRRRCGRCWYELAADAGAGTRCPECGHVALRDRDCTRRRRCGWAVLVGVVLMLTGAAPLAGSGRARRLWLMVLPTWRVTNTVSAGPYTFLELEARDETVAPPRMVEVRQNGAVVWRLRSFYPSLGGVSVADDASLKPVGIGEDITGDGRPDFVVTDTHGGSGGLGTTYIFTLDPSSDGPTLRPLAVLPAGGSWRRREGAAAWDFVAADPTFAYWWTSGAASPRPEIVFSWKADHYAVNRAAMHRPAPTAVQIAAWARSDRERSTVLGRDGREPFLSRALHLIYSGNAEAAWNYLRAAWPAEDPLDAEEAIRAVRERLKESVLGEE